MTRSNDKGQAKCCDTKLHGVVSDFITNTGNWTYLVDIPKDNWKHLMTWTKILSVLNDFILIVLFMELFSRSRLSGSS